MTPFWVQNLDLKMESSRSVVFELARLPKTVSASKSVGIIGMTGCCFQLVMCLRAWNRFETAGTCSARDGWTSTRSR